MQWNRLRRSLGALGFGIALVIGIGGAQPAFADTDSSIQGSWLVKTSTFNLYTSISGSLTGYSPVGTVCGGYVKGLTGVVTYTPGSLYRASSGLTRCVTTAYLTPGGRIVTDPNAK